MAPTFCQRCAEPVDPQHRFCPRCGMGLSAAGGDARGAPRLRLHEQVLLLALDDESGRLLPAASHCNFGLSAALLAELLLERRIELDPARSEFVELRSEAPTGDGVLDEVLGRIAASRRRRRLRTWVSNLSNLRKLKDRIGEGLCRRGILERRDGRFLFVHWVSYPTRDPLPEYAVIDRLRLAVFDDSPALDERTMILLALAYHTYLLRVRFGTAELRRRDRQIRETIANAPISAALRRAIEEMNAAVAACVVAVAAASSG